MKKLIILPLLALCCQVMAQTPAGNKTKQTATKEVIAPEIALPSLGGDTLTLSSLRGKYVVVDFWGKWCYWCMKGMPDMKKYYEKYKGKLEILGVNYGDTHAVWKQTVEEQKLPWKHVKMGKADQKLLTDYAVQGFPTKIIISPQGKIIRTIVGEDPEFYTLLDQLLGK